MKSNTAVLWTGGKDSSLALYEAELRGYEIKSLVTFIPHKPRFLAHPLGFMRYQAEALGLPHYTIQVDEPFKAGYESAVSCLRMRGINTLITGDIADVDGYPNWITECSKCSDVNVLSPLWGTDRRELIEKLLLYEFKVVFSCVKSQWFTIEWLGRELNSTSLEELLILNAQTGLDICGEQGEYHTLVLDMPLFQKSISIDRYSKETSGSLMYLNIQEVSLKDKLLKCVREGGDDYRKIAG